MHNNTRQMRAQVGKQIFCICLPISNIDDIGKDKIMYYRLKQSYSLRGWSKRSWVLVKRPENSSQQLTQNEFQTLLLCDGETELTEEILDSTLRETLKKCQEKGIIETCETSAPLEQDQYYKVFNNRYVNKVFWSITGRCNYRCRHCYMDAPDGALGELSTEKALALIDEMAACGVLHVDITGGEPFVRKDFWRLVDHILSHKIVIGKIYTNGWLLNESVLDEFEQRGIRPAFSVSFDGVNWHDWMRGIKGAEQAALNALKLCKARGFRTDVEMCIHRGNLDSLPQTIQSLCEIGVTDLKVSNVALTDLWENNSEGNALTPQEYTEAMMRYIPWYFQKGQPINLIISGVIALRKDRPYKIVAEPYDGTEKCLDCHMCGATRWACYITPEGRLLPCMPMTASPEQNRFPKVQEIGLKQGLSDSYYMEFVNGRVKDLLAANKECGECPYRLRCGGGCRATALLDGNHDLMGCDRTMCMLWKEGYVDRIRQVTEEAIAKYGENATFKPDESH